MFDEIKRNMEEIFDVLRELELSPTPRNVSIMNGVYSLLKQSYHILEEMDDAGKSNEPEVGTAVGDG